MSPTHPQLETAAQELVKVSISLLAKTGLRARAPCPFLHQSSLDKNRGAGPGPLSSGIKKAVQSRDLQQDFGGGGEWRRGRPI